MAWGNQHRMRLLTDALWVLRFVTGARTRYRRPGPSAAVSSPTAHRELARIMRNLPGQFADRLSDRTCRRIKTAAAAGQWEQAIKTLITVLRRHARPVTAQEHDQLNALLAALNMPSKLLDTLTRRP